MVGDGGVIVVLGKDVGGIVVGMAVERGLVAIGAAPDSNAGLHAAGRVNTRKVNITTFESFFTVLRWVGIKFSPS